MIAITGANGNLGKATAEFLISQTNPQNVIAIVRDASKVADLESEGVEVRVADYNDPASLNRALKGVKKLLQISAASMGPEAGQQELNVVDAAKAQGIEHIVYTSTLCPSPDAYFQAGAVCAQTEKAITASGISHTFFRNSMYMETIPLFMGDAIRVGHFYYPDGKGKVSYAYRSDIAEALANVLLSGDNSSKTYNITGSASYSFKEIAEIISKEKNMDLGFTEIPNEVYREELSKIDMPQEIVEFYITMANSIRANEFETVDPALANLLNRKPLSLNQFLQKL